MRAPSSIISPTEKIRAAVLRIAMSAGCALAACAARAQDQSGAGSQPSETVSVVFVVLFGIAFVAMIVGFLVYLWMNERKRKAAGSGHEA